MAVTNVQLQNTRTAATAAHRAGMIDQASMCRMTDGTVSWRDLRAAEALVTEQAGQAGNNTQAQLAQKLLEALKEQLGAQGGVRTGLETLKDGATGR